MCVFVWTQSKLTIYRKAVPELDKVWQALNRVSTGMHYSAFYNKESKLTSGLTLGQQIKQIQHESIHTYPAGTTAILKQEQTRMILKAAIMLLLNFRSTLKEKTHHWFLAGARPESYERKTMMSWHTLTYNCQQRTAEGQWLAASCRPVALEDESHHAIEQDQQITVRCPLARPLQTKAIFPSALEGLQTTINWGGQHYSKN